MVLVSFTCAVKTWGNYGVRLGVSRRAQVQSRGVGWCALDEQQREGARVGGSLGKGTWDVCVGVAILGAANWVCSREVVVCWRSTLEQQLSGRISALQKLIQVTNKGYLFYFGLLLLIVSPLLRIWKPGSCSWVRQGRNPSQGYPEREEQRVESGGVQKAMHKLEGWQKSIRVSDLAAPLGEELLDCYFSGVQVCWVSGSPGKVTIVPAKSHSIVCSAIILDIIKVYFTRFACCWI